MDHRVPQLLQKFDLQGSVEKMVNAPSFDEKMKAKLEEISATPEGAMLMMMKSMMGGNFDQLVPLVKPTLVALGKDLTSGIDVILSGTSFGGVLNTKVYREELKYRQGAIFISTIFVHEKHRKFSDSNLVPAQTLGY